VPCDYIKLPYIGIIGIFELTGLIAEDVGSLLEKFEEGQCIAPFLWSAYFGL
jgi:hypothetical protein